MLKVIPNAKKVAFKAYSMWANYLGILVLITPELLFLFAGIDTNPAIWFIAGLVLIIAGIIGRILDQEGVEDE